MTMFVLLAAAMLLLALAFVVVPLLRRPRAAPTAAANLTVLADAMRELDEDLAAGRIDAREHGRANDALRRQALAADAVGQRQERGRGANWGAALALGITVPLSAVALYLVVGQPGALMPAGQQTAGVAAAGHERQMDAAVQALAQRLERGGGDADSWMLLARSQLSGGRADQAARAYARASALRPGDADLLVEYANAVAMAQQRDLSGQPQELLARALALDADNLNALALAGAAALQAGDRAGALKHWGRLEQLVAADPEDLQRVRALLARARGEAGGEAPRSLAAAPPDPAAAGAGLAQVAAQAPAGGAAITGTVSVAETLAARVAPSDTLFVFARAPGGPPMPVEARRDK
ncbi:MAG: c-type cytochrome biogenesis protein CcmI [Proteobacteria bacterium]|nr:c-type cytochrome biogenesis protein CcmI [Pseudomonadota bacterium]